MSASPTILVACKSCKRQYDVGAMKPGEQVRCACGRPIVVPAERPRVARVLHCSACGGDLGDRATSCRYCGSKITAAERNMGPACPICFARLPADARYCSECGVGINPEHIRTTPVDVACPRCAGQLLLRELESMLLTDCTACGGLWLDAQAFDNLVRAKDTRRLATASIAPGPVARLEPDIAKYIPCLVCKKLMERKNFASCSGVIIDWCRGHGVWFDASELEQIVKFIEQGGLEKAQKMGAVVRPAARPGPAAGGFASGPAPRPTSPLPTTPAPGYSGGGGWDWASFILYAVAEIFL